MAVTRRATGHSAPRKPLPSSLLPSPFKSKPSKKPTTTTTTTTTTKSTGGGATANMSKPRAKTKAVAGGRVGKKGNSTTATSTKTNPGGQGLKRKPRKTGVVDKVSGLMEKAVGTVEGRPGKKAAGTKKIRGTDGKGVPRGS